MIDEGVTRLVARQRAEKYTQKLIRTRAQTIARTETMRASNEGQAQLWRQAQEMGLLTGKEQKVWQVADPCPICAPLDGERVGINEDFSVGQDPPLHPRCRCTFGLVAA
jgi:SPP1 gp7 family putative phage head morphogenesis protein